MNQPLFFSNKILDRFWSKTDLVGPCWIWKNGTSRGYGQFKLHNKKTPAHRFSYELYHGKIPKGLQLDHLCRNRACVNPTHLEPVTQQENIRRGDNSNKGIRNFEKTHCPQGHEYSEFNIIKNNGSRVCRECNRIRCRKYYKKHYVVDKEEL